jgi:VanZ family protein
MGRLMTLKRVATVLLIAYWIVLFLGTHVPIREEHVPRVARTWGGVIPLDKLVHFGGYFVLAFLMSWAWSGGTRLGWRGLLAVFVAASAYGAIDELTQEFVETRYADLMDWVANTCGAAAGVAAYAFVRAGWHRFSARPSGTDEVAASEPLAR